jgi:hypothetical protein
VTADTPTTITASFTSGGVTKAATRAVTIINVVKIPARPADLSIQ